MIVGKHEIQTFEFVIVVLLFLLLFFDDFVPTSAHRLLCLDKSFAQLHLNVRWTQEYRIGNHLTLIASLKRS